MQFDCTDYLLIRLTRLTNPVTLAICFNGIPVLLNYVFGVTQFSLKDYIFGSFGIIPDTVMYVYIASLAGNLVMIMIFFTQRRRENEEF